MCLRFFFLCRACDVGGIFENGGEFESQDSYSVLVCSASEGHAECVRLLIDAGADKDAKCDVRFVLCLLSSSL
jgi:hypothetical protein